MLNDLLGPHTSKAALYATTEYEVDLCIKETLIDCRNGDPLIWWRENEACFQLLAAQARTYRCPPPSPLHRERVVSELSLTFDKNRSRLTGEKSWLCFLHHNLVLLDWKYQGGWTGCTSNIFRKPNQKPNHLWSGNQV